MPSSDPRPVTEAALQKAVTDLCRLYGLRWHHQRISQLSAPGWPDLTIAGRRLLFRELKRQTGYPTEAQLDWLHALRKAGADADVWRPSDLASGRIQRELEALR